MDIFEAAKNGDTAAMKEQIKKGVSVNAKDRDNVPPIVWAACIAGTKMRSGF